LKPASQPASPPIRPAFGYLLFFFFVDLGPAQICLYFVSLLLLLLLFVASALLIWAVVDVARRAPGACFGRTG
jgi:hypothetical protein